MDDMRIKESEYDIRIPDNEWIVVRLDGRSFSRLTKSHFIKPFDQKFHGLMLQTMMELITDLQALYAYTASDEISLVFPLLWDEFDRRLEKIVSLSASIASSTFTLASDHAVQFDSRVTAFYSMQEVIQYFQWRLADIRRCAMQTLAYWTLRHAGESAARATCDLKEKTWQEKDRMLQEEYGIVFGDLPGWQQRGVGVVWERYEKAGFDPIKNVDVVAERRRLSVVGIPDNYGKFLQNIL